MIGLGGDVRKHQLSGSSARRASYPSVNEDAGSGAIPGAGEEGQERRPRGLERVPDARRCRIHHPTNPRRTPATKMRRRKKRPLPLQRGKGRKGRPPQLGRPKGPRRGKPFLWTIPPTPTTAKRSGSPGPSPWQNRKYPDTGVIHSIRLLLSFPLCRICLCSPPKDRLNASSSGSLDSSKVNSLPTTSSPRPMDDTEVLSQQVPSREEVVPEAPQGDLPDSRSKGDETP